MSAACPASLVSRPGDARCSPGPSRRPAELVGDQRLGGVAVRVHHGAHVAEDRDDARRRRRVRVHADGVECRPRTLDRVDSFELSPGVVGLPREHDLRARIRTLDRCVRSVEQRYVRRCVRGRARSSRSPARSRSATLGSAPGGRSGPARAAPRAVTVDKRGEEGGVGPVGGGPPRPPRLSPVTSHAGAYMTVGSTVIPCAAASETSSSICAKSVGTPPTSRSARRSPPVARQSSRRAAPPTSRTQRAPTRPRRPP